MHRLTKKEINDDILIADNLLINKSWLNLSWLIPNNNKNKAIDLYKELYDDAILINEYELGAIIALKLATLLKSYDYYQKAASNYKLLGKLSQAIEIYNILIDILEKDNQLIILAECLEKIGNIYEERYNYDKVLQVYKRASDIYHDINQNDKTIELLSRCADIYIYEYNDVIKAKDIYQKILYNFNDNKLDTILSFDYIFMLLLCEFNLHVKIKNINLYNLLEKCIESYPLFKDSSEYHLLDNCINAYNDNKIDDITKILNQYNSIWKLNDIKMKLFNEIKKFGKNKKYIGDIIY